jgi:hypothetical protein
MIEQSNTIMNVELSRNRSIVSRHTTLRWVLYTIFAVGFSPVFFEPVKNQQSR